MRFTEYIDSAITSPQVALNDIWVLNLPFFKLCWWLVTSSRWMRADTHLPYAAIQRCDADDRNWIAIIVNLLFHLFSESQCLLILPSRSSSSWSCVLLDTCCGESYILQQRATHVEYVCNKSSVCDPLVIITFFSCTNSSSSANRFINGFISPLISGHEPRKTSSPAINRAAINNNPVTID